MGIFKKLCNNSCKEYFDYDVINISWHENECRRKFWRWIGCYFIISMVFWKIVFTYSLNFNEKRAPFTIQRLCELLAEPKKQYKSLKKFIFAVEKV